MRVTTMIGLALLVLLVSPIILAVGNNFALAQSPQAIEQTCRVAVFVGGDLDQDSVLQARRMLENKGLIYDVVADNNASFLDADKYGVILVLGYSQPQISSNLASIREAVENGVGLIWVGQGLPLSLWEFVGLTDANTLEIEPNTARIKYFDASTKLFGESVESVISTSATIEGYFVDNSGVTLGAAELSFKKSTAGLTYYFAYDVFSWWFSDEQSPWLRAYRVHLAIENVLSEHSAVRLLPYPRGMQSAFVTRIEDVDPLHTNSEWLSRGKQLLNYYSERNVGLTISFTPTYVDPELNLNFGIEEPQDQPLRLWLSEVLMNGGTIVEHGYTHQIGDWKTGVAPEFYDESTQTWMSFENQKLRIKTGASQIHESLGFDPKGFEAPHYVANSDTYLALSELGFQYVTQNSNTAFFDRFGLAQGLVNVPETLGYIPLNSTQDVKAGIVSNMDLLYEMGGVMLYFNHLFDDQMLQTGKELLDQAIAKRNIWLTNAGNLADFWAQRYKAYEFMSTSISNDGNVLTVNLGPSNRAGLTLALENFPQIKNVEVNGLQWSVFNGSQVVLPVLLENQNTVTVTFSEADTNANQVFGYSAIILSIFVSLFIVFRKSGIEKIVKSLAGWRKK